MKCSRSGSFRIYGFKVCTRKETRLNSNKIKFKLKKLEKEQQNKSQSE